MASNTSKIASNRFWQETAEHINRIATAENDSSIKRRALMLRDVFKNPRDDARSILGLWNAAQRLILIEKAGLIGYPALDYIQDCPVCAKMPPLPVSQELQASLAEQFLSSPAPIDNPNIMLIVAEEGAGVAIKMIERYLETGVAFDMIFFDYEFMTRMIERCGLDGLKAAGAHLTGLFEDSRVQKVNVLGAQQDPKQAAREEKGRSEALKAWVANGFRKRASSIDKYYTLTRIPTESDAERDGKNYPEYLQLFFEMCDQPWEEIEKAQGLLIERLNAGQKLRITNSDGTDVTFDITGQTFANSVISKNIPGSEVFSAPLLNGTNGVIVAKGNFAYADEGVQRYMQNLHLVFHAGILAPTSYAEVGNDDFQAIVSKPGANQVGEVAFGTNPRLREHVVNGLLVEKVGGSFHVALGACYNYTTYMGKPVQLSNGSVSKVHWDVTTMLYGKDGKVWLDGDLIQDKGVFIDPALAILNTGKIR